MLVSTWSVTIVCLCAYAYACAGPPSPPHTRFSHVPPLGTPPPRFKAMHRPSAPPSPLFRFKAMHPPSFKAMHRPSAPPLLRFKAMHHPLLQGHAPPLHPALPPHRFKATHHPLLQGHAPPLHPALPPHRFKAMHHPFTAPQPDDLMSGDLSHARAIAYDLVYNGVEVGGGSLRIYRWGGRAKGGEGQGRGGGGGLHKILGGAGSRGAGVGGEGRPIYTRTCNIHHLISRMSPGHPSDHAPHADARTPPHTHATSPAGETSSSVCLS